MKLHLSKPPKLSNRQVALDTEWFKMDKTRLHRPHGDFACLSIAVEDDVYLVTDPKDIAPALKAIDRCNWVMQEGDFDITQLRRYAPIPPRPYWDTLFVEKAMFSNYYDRFDLASLSRRWLQRVLDKETRELFVDADVMTDEMVRYATTDAWTTLRIAEAQQAYVHKHELESMIRSVWYETDLPALWAVLDMRGVCVDVEQWKQIVAEQNATLESLRAEFSFDVGSPKQLGQFLMSQGIKLPLTKKGNPSTNEETLLKIDHPMIQKVLDFRAAQKFAGTYGEEFVERLEDGRLYERWNIYGTETGRFSARKLQLIPKRDPVWGPRYRRAFVPARGNVFVKADYVQCQVVVMAQVSDDKAFKEMFEKGEDVHTQNAAWLYKVSPESVTKEQRSRAKGITFGLQFGETASTLAQRENISRQEAQRFIDSYFGLHTGLAMWTHNQLRATDYVESPVGRRTWLNPYGGKHDENCKLNFPIQMGEADIHKKMLAKLHRGWPKEWGPFGLVLPVHDEVVVEAPRKYARACKKFVKQCALEAESEVLPDVRPAVDVSICKNWYSDE